MKLENNNPSSTASNQARVFDGEGDAKGKYAIVVSRFNEQITSQLLEGALKGLKEKEILPEAVDVFWCPGAFEIPFTCQTIVRQKNYDAIIALGVVIRGETPHFDYVAEGASRGIQEVSLKENVPIAFGILTTENADQAFARAEKEGDNKGYDAALAAVQMVQLQSKIKSI